MVEKKPWWANDPEIAAIRRGVMDEIQSAGREPIRPDVPGTRGARSVEFSAFRSSSCTAGSADPRRQQLLEHSRVADGVSTEVVVEVHEHPQAFCMPFGDAVGPLAQLVVRV
jgi:hypothetical protein